MDVYGYDVHIRVAKNPFLLSRDRNMADAAAADDVDDGKGGAERTLDGWNWQ